MKRSLKNRILFKLVRLPIPWVIRRILSNVCAIFLLRYKYTNKNFNSINQLFENGQFITNVEKILNINDDFIQQLYIQATKSSLKDQWGNVSHSYGYENIPPSVNTSTVIFNKKLNNDVYNLGIEIGKNEIVKSYFNSIPKLSNYQIWFSHPGRTQSGPQLWHRDIDNLYFLKVFIYLTDVREEDGPHYYLCKSHKWNKFLRFSRFDDQELSNHYSDVENSYCLGKRGTMIFEDTFGFHRGSVPKSDKSRCILQFQYSLFPNP